MNYDYKCEACNHRFERNVPVSKRDDACVEPCPECGATKVKRPPSLPGLSSQAMTPERKAGDGWQDVLKKIKSGAGRRSTIQTR